MRTCLQRNVWSADCKQGHQLRTNSKGQDPGRPTVRLGPYLCGLTLLLELLELLGSEETHGLIASNELSARWHSGEDDVAAQPTEAVDGKQNRVSPPTQNQAMHWRKTGRSGAP